MKEYKIYIDEEDLHYKLLDFLDSKTEYGLDQQIKNTDKATSKDFKSGAMWGCAMFLIFAGSKCNKIVSRVLTEDEEKSKDDK